jgi:hypothetical protein
MGTDLSTTIGRSSRPPRICDWLALSGIAVIALTVPEAVEGAMAGIHKLHILCKKER